jgi:hypothetical protein
MRHNHFKFYRNRSAAKGSLLLRAEEFLVLIWPRIPVGFKLQVWSISGSIERHLTIEAKTFCPCLPLHCTGVTETSHLKLATHVLQALQFWPKSVSEEGHFTLEVDTVFRQ